MIGTCVNVGTIVAGTVVGKLAGRKMPPALQSTLTNSIALIVIGIGVLDIKDIRNGIVVFASLIVGGIIGETLRIDQGLNWLGTKAEEKFGSDIPENSFSKAFVTSSLLFCVGPLTILGSLEDGISGDYSKLLVKAALDGISSIAMAASLGWGVLLSAATVLLLQGTLTFCASEVKPLLTDIMITEMSGVGGLILLGMGLNILGVTTIRTASLLPALVVALPLASRWG
jgi:uncharacterized protein